MSETIIVDDSNLAELTYAGTWTKGGSSNEYNRCANCRVSFWSCLIEAGAQHNARNQGKGSHGHVQVYRYVVTSSFYDKTKA